MPRPVPTITTMKAKNAVRRAIQDMKDTIRAVSALLGFGERVRFERQIEDLDYLQADIMRRIDTSREPAAACTCMAAVVSTTTAPHSYASSKT